MLRKIAPRKVTLGMYVAGFGGSWFDHPFWKAHFEVRKERDLERIRQAYIPYVLIDDARGVAPVEDETKKSARQASGPQPAAPARCLAEPVKLREIASSRTSQRQMDMARSKAMINRSAKAMHGVLDDARLGRAIKFETVTRVVDDIVAGVERTPNVMLTVLRMKGKDEYTYFHSVAVCTLMANFARHVGMEESAIRDYGLAGLLHDIGKAGVPEDILNKEGRLTDDEFALVRKHPAHGHAILLDTHEDIPTGALEVCRYHHEKMDGTGYPAGLKGNAIPEIARMGAICDVYDALTSDRAYKDAWTPPRALGEMWRWEGHFDHALLFAFMQSIAIFPPGMLVTLRSNRLGLVLDNRRRNSRPRILAFYDTRDRAFLEPKELVITDGRSGDAILSPAEPASWGLGGLDLSDEKAIRKLARKRAA